VIVAREPDATDVIRAERAFLIASRNVWDEIDRLSVQPGGYRGLAPETDLRLIEREAWERYRDACDAADLMICPRCDGQQYDRGSCAVCRNTGYAWVGDS
jgi:hypothetical protein